MARKRALVVDDSRSARLILQRMLQKHELEVDTAESAEQAIEYLTRHRPHVIFMDHMMPGMDGFEAVKVIKNDPNTATIPIMMYTSKEGDLYVSQARALGAVGVLPKQIKQAELLEVLDNLRLLEPANESEPAVVSEEESLDQLATLSTQLIEDIARSAVEESLQRIVDERLAEQRSKLRRDIQTSNDALVERLLAQLKPAEPIEEPLGPHEYVKPRRSPWPVATVVAAVAVAVVLGLSVWQRQPASPAAGPAAVTGAPSNQGDRAQASLQQVALRQNLEEQRLDAERQRKLLLSSLNWAMQQNNLYSYDEVALGGERVQFLNELLARLAAAGFQGRVQLRVHAGDFCLLRNRVDELELAPPGTPLPDCDQLGWPDADSRGKRQTVSFANFVSSSPLLAKDDLALEIVSVGNREPLVPYPSDRASQESESWNRIAQRNHRVEIRLLPPSGAVIR